MPESPEETLPHAEGSSLETIASDPSASPATLPADVEALLPARGTIIGRYVTLSKLGSGAMGVVFAAYDPELDRRVAIKLLRPRGHSVSRREAATSTQRIQSLAAELRHLSVTVDVATQR